MSTQSSLTTGPCSAPRAPISGVEEVDAIILSYLSVDALHHLVLDQQRSRSPPHILLADDSMVWALKLSRTLGFVIIHARGVPYRTLFIVATTRLKSVDGGEGSDSWSTVVSKSRHEDWYGMAKYTIVSVTNAAILMSKSDRLEREVLGLLVAVLDHINSELLSSVTPEIYNVIMNDAALETIRAMYTVGCVEGWEALIARYLHQPLPSDFPMTRYGYDKYPHVQRSSSLSRTTVRFLLAGLCKLMLVPNITVREMERLVVTYLWPITSQWVSQHNMQWDECYEACMGALRRSIAERHNPSEILTTLAPMPLTPVDGIELRTKALINENVWMYREDACSSPEMWRFFTTWLVPLTLVEDIRATHDKLVEEMLWSETRSVDDYAILELVHSEPNIRKLTGQDLGGDDQPLRVPLAATQDMEYTLIKVFLARIRTLDSANRFMAYVERNSNGRDIPTEAGAMRLSSPHYQKYYQDPPHRYPHLMMVYDAFYGRFDAAMIESLIYNDIRFGTDDTPYRFSVITAIVEAGLSGRSVKRSIDENDSIYDAILHLMRAMRMPIYTYWTHRDFSCPNGTMHGTSYGVIAAAMYDEALFAAALDILAPTEAYDDTRVDLLMQACAQRYVEAVREDDNQSTIGEHNTDGRYETDTSLLTHSVGSQRRMETIAHERCMLMLAEYCRTVTLPLDEWNVEWQREHRAVMQATYTLHSGRFIRHRNYPGHSMWAAACISSDPLVTSALLPMAECRYSGSQGQPFSCTATYWIGYKALDPMRPQDYDALVAISDRLSVDGIDPDASDDSGTRKDITIGPTREQALTWLRDLLPLLWDANKYDALVGALGRVHENDK